MLDKYVKHAWEVIRNVPRHGEEEFLQDPTAIGRAAEGGNSRGGRWEYAHMITLNDNIKLN